MTDKLDKIMEKQLEFQEMLYGVRWPLTPKELNKELAFQVQCITDEAHELLHTTNWKPWRKQKPNLIESKKEAIDIFTFVLNVFNNLGMSADDVYRMYNEKLKINYKRQGCLDIDDSQ